jgi:hypothetical protein
MMKKEKELTYHKLLLSYELLLSTTFSFYTSIIIL